MKSLRFRILIIFVLVFLCSTIATWMISDHVSRQMAGDYLAGSDRLELEQARSIFETSGKAALQRYFAQVDSALKGTRSLLDSRGFDVVSGTDRRQFRSAADRALNSPQTEQPLCCVQQKNARPRCRGCRRGRARRPRRGGASDRPPRAQAAAESSEWNRP